MAKYLLIFLACLAVYALWRAHLHKRAAPRHPPAPESPPPSPTPPTPSPMVRCHHCGVHLPHQEAIAYTYRAQTQFYCSAEHHRLGTSDISETSGH